MAGGTLIVSRAVKMHTRFKEKLEKRGFSDVSVTSTEKDALNMLIDELKPGTLIMGARFYECCTPYMLGQLKRNYPKINMAALSIVEYPADLAMYFIVNGAIAYVSAFDDGLDCWYECLESIKKGKEYISPIVQERINIRGEFPKAARKLTARQLEIIRCLCNGFNEAEIADVLGYSINSIDSFKREIYTKLNVRKCTELIRVALYQKIITQEELVFSPRGLTLRPRPINKEQRAKKREQRKENKDRS
jgi:DNA-binding NarL/FixJ family response regulator